MNTELQTTTGRRWFRVLRPLFWWLIFVLLLFGIRTHQRLSEQTLLRFSVSIQGRPMDYEATAILDGRPIRSGQRFSIGSHKFSVSHPKGVRFFTNLFVWYGEHDLGEIALTRATGGLNVLATPAAELLTIRGPEFRLTLTNSTGTNFSVPTDNYFVTAKYTHWDQEYQVSISDISPQTVRFAPRLGALQMTCNQLGASFQLNKVDGRLIEAGEFPSAITELPEGRYELVAQHHGHQRQQIAEVKGNMTNDVRVEYVYGAVVFETQPTGATVSSDNNREWGKTPLNLRELETGTWNFVVRHEGYEPVLATFEIVGNQINTFRTNLISTTYVGAVNAARRFLASKEYGQAYEAAMEALRVQPDDAVADALKRQAIGLENLLLAEALGKKDDYTGGIQKLALVIEALPDNELAKQLLADYKKREPEQIERNRQERWNRGSNLFGSILRRYGDAELFEAHEQKTAKPVKDVGLAIISTLKMQPPFQITRYTSTAPETFEIEATQDLMTVLATTAGRRQCVIVGAQTRDEETQVLFKVLEYKSEAVNKFSIGNLIGAPVNIKLVPIHSSRIGTLTDKLQAQITQGATNMIDRIHRAIGQPSENK